MKKNLHTLIALMFTATVYCQDSTNLLSEQFRQRYAFYSTDVISQPLNRIAKYTNVEAGYNMKSGDYMLAQDAPKEKNLFFRTKGARQLKQYLVSGFFEYENIHQDSVAYTLRYGLDDAAPYYLYAAAKGNWQVAKYNLQGIVSRSVAHDKLLIGAGLTYRAHNAWRSNDPRPENFFYHMDIAATVHYLLPKKQSIGIEGGIIKKSSETTIEYRNKDYQLGLAYPDYINYLQYGYGFVRINQNSFFKSATNGFKAKTMYKKQFGHDEIALKGGYTYTSSEYTGTATTLEPGGIFGYFYEKTWNGNFYWNHKQKNNTYSTTVDYSHYAGKDKNTFLNGNNYLYLAEKLSIASLYAHIRNHFLQYELGLQANYNLLSRADGNAAQCAVYRYTNIGALAAYYFKTNTRGDFLKALVHGNVFVPVSSLMQSPAQEPDFTRKVIYHDYYYYTAHAWLGSLDLQYQCSIRQVKPFVRAQVTYQKADIQQSTIQTGNMPGNSRWWWQASVGVNL